MGNRRVPPPRLSSESQQVRAHVRKNTALRGSLLSGQSCENHGKEAQRRLPGTAGYRPRLAPVPASCRTPPAALPSNSGPTTFLSPSRFHREKTRTGRPGAGCCGIFLRNSGVKDHSRAEKFCAAHFSPARFGFPPILLFLRVCPPSSEPPHS